MALKFSEMIALRTDLARNLEAGFDSYLEEIATGCGDYLAPVVEEGESAIDVAFLLLLLRRSVARHSRRIRSLNEGVVEQTHDDDKVRAELAGRRDAVDAKLRLVRHTCRGLFGSASLGRIGITGEFPRGPMRLFHFAEVVKASLEKPDLGLEALLDLDLEGDGGSSITARLAAQLEPELGELGELLDERHDERRKATNVRLRRQQEIRHFDTHIRGIVRMAQGMFRLAGRADLAQRFRPTLQRVLRRLKARPAEGEAGAAPGSAEAVPDPAIQPAEAEATTD
ncbi:MAG: hypothetical protein AAF657_22065 [Acidobacteriota bacterium]